jgi:hypothetical protein
MSKLSLVKLERHLCAAAKHDVMSDILTGRVRVPEFVKLGVVP